MVLRFAELGKPVGHDGQNASWTRDANATSLCVTANQPCVVSPSRSWPSFLGRYPPLSLSPRLRLALLLFLLLLLLLLAAAVVPRATNAQDRVHRELGQYNKRDQDAIEPREGGRVEDGGQVAEKIFAFLPSLCVRCRLPAVGNGRGASCELEVSPLKFTPAPVTIPHLQVGGAHSTQQRRTDRKDLLFLVETAGLFTPSCSHIPYTIIQCGRHFFPNTMPPPRAPAAKQAPTSLPLAACCPSRSSSLSPLSVWSL